MKRAFAQGTEVPVERSRAEIEKLVTQRGAKEFASAWNETRAVIGFVINGRALRFELPIPPKDAREFRVDGRGCSRTPDGRVRAFDGELRRRWRCLALSIKAKFETVASGIVTFEEEFLPHFVVPTEDGPKRFSEVALPALARAYECGEMPPLLPARATPEPPRIIEGSRP